MATAALLKDYQCAKFGGVTSVLWQSPRRHILFLFYQKGNSDDNIMHYIIYTHIQHNNTIRYCIYTYIYSTYTYTYEALSEASNCESSRRVK